MEQKMVLGINLLYISEIKKSNCIPASLSKSNLCLPSTKFTQMVCHFWEKKKHVHGPVSPVSG